LRNIKKRYRDRKETANFEGSLCSSEFLNKWKRTKRNIRVHSGQWVAEIFYLD
jgi:hypothetical protein